MKREKEQWLRIFNGVMFGALILLGFAYCDENSMGAGSENCTSYAKYEFRGKVLGESRQVVPDARILVKHIASPADGSYGYAVLSDTVYTKENGEYLYQNTITGYQDFRIICEDLTGVYQTDSVDIKMNPKGGNGRYEGKDNREIVFKLKKRANETAKLLISLYLFFSFSYSTSTASGRPASSSPRYSTPFTCLS